MRGRSALSAKSLFADIVRPFGMQLSWGIELVIFLEFMNKNTKEGEMRDLIWRAIRGGPLAADPHSPKGPKYPPKGS